jgi:hypothetical protein
MNQETRKPGSPADKPAVAGTRKAKLVDCAIGDYVRFGDDPFDANLRSHIYIQVPAPMPPRTLSDELANGMDFKEVMLPSPFLFEREPWSNDGRDRFYVWRRVS